MTSTRILIIRTSALGDVVHTLPVLTALRRNFPSSCIGWLVEDAYTPLLEGHSDLDEVIPVRLRAWRKRPFSPHTWVELGRFLMAMERFSAEIVLDLMGNHKAGVLAALSLADRRLGPERGARREPSSAVWINEVVAARGTHSVDRTLSLLDGLGIEDEPADFGADKLPAAGQPADGDIVLIHPGAGWANKCYPPELWGQVSGLLREALGVRIGVVVGPGEQQLAQTLVSASDGTTEVLWAPDLLQLIELLRSASLVMGGDTGPIHLAHALGRPVLCLMGPTRPDRHGPYSAPASALWRSLPCSFCHKRYQQVMPCLSELPPEAVADRAKGLLEGGTSAPPGPIGTGGAGCPILH